MSIEWLREYVQSVAAFLNGMDTRGVEIIKEFDALKSDNDQLKEACRQWLLDDLEIKNAITEAGYLVDYIARDVPIPGRSPNKPVLRPRFAEPQLT